MIPTPNAANISNDQSDWRLTIDNTANSAYITTGINNRRCIHSDSKNSKLPPKNPNAISKGVNRQ